MGDFLSLGKNALGGFRETAGTIAEGGGGGHSSPGAALAAPP